MTAGALATLRTSLLDHLVWWVLAAVAAGLAVPIPAAPAWLVLAVLAVMVGSISLTLDPRSLAGAPWATVAMLTAAGALLPVLGWGAASVFDAPGGLLLGLVVFFAAPPELTTPVLTRVARGDVALSVGTLLLASLASLLVVPAAVHLLGGTPAVLPLVRSLAVAVILPMAVALTVRGRAAQDLRRHDQTFATVSAAMLVLVMLLVAAASREALFAAPRLAAIALAAGLPVLVVGGVAGAWLGRLGERRRRGGPARSGSGLPWSGAARAGALSLGVRDFAVAAALVVAAGLPDEGAVAALALGVAELVLASWAAGRWRRSPPAGAPRAT